MQEMGRLSTVMYPGVSTNSFKSFWNIENCYGALYYINDNITTCMLVNRTTDPHPVESLLMGATARSVAAVAVLPFTVLKTRYEVSKPSNRYRISRNCICDSLSQSDLQRDLVYLLQGLSIVNEQLVVVVVVGDECSDNIRQQCR